MNGEDVRCESPGCSMKFRFVDSEILVNTDSCVERNMLYFARNRLLRIRELLSVYFGKVSLAKKGDKRLKSLRFQRIIS